MNPQCHTKAISPVLPAMEVIAKVERIDAQADCNGVLIPVAQLQPIQVAGVTITHATLHDFQELARKDIREGDTVVVRCAGAAIPEVVRALLEFRPHGAQPFTIPGDRA